MKSDLFQSCGHCWVFQICWHIECSSFTASSLRIWNSSTGIPSPPPALFVMMLSKAHLTSHSRMSGSRWVITPSWLSWSWRSHFVASATQRHIHQATQAIVLIVFKWIKHCSYHMCVSRLFLLSFITSNLFFANKFYFHLCRRPVVLFFIPHIAMRQHEYLCKIGEQSAGKGCWEFFAPGVWWADTCPAHCLSKLHP